MHHLLLYFLFSIFLMMQFTGCTACIDVERTALWTFKSKLKDPRNLLSTWKGQDCCSWKGVTCHNQSGHVVKLNLRNDPYSREGPYVSLNGKIDPSLISLRNLTHLDLSGNNFNETEIPNFTGQFENLVYLNLSLTEFVGKIPNEIGNLKRLRYLDMSHTNFGESIPPELGNISTLSFLSFRYGSYNITIENIQWISNFPSLQYLDLSFLDLSAITDWFYLFNKLKNLKVLMLSGCNLRKIPSHVASLNFSRMATLDLSSNWFESSVPGWLGNLTSASHLDLSNAGFSGLSNGFWSISEKRICQLRYLDLSQVNITEDITDFLRRFSCSWKIIEVLSLANNNLHGKLLTDWITEMPSLEHLDLRQNSIAGAVPLEIVNLSKLNYLDLSNNGLQGTVSQSLLENLAQLQVLDLSLNMLKIVTNHNWLPKFQLTELALQSCDVGPLFPPWLRFQIQIKYLNLKNSSIDDALPPWFWRRSYRLIDLSSNSLHGKLPHNLQSPHLNVLILASNNLSGPIKSLPKGLSVLDISNNKFSGTLVGVLNASTLSWLSVKNNLFTGEIPTMICENVYLSALVLSMNNFSGMIPNCLSRLENLQLLDMSFNNLSGTVPNSIGSMVNLISLVLHGNILTGEIPKNLQHCRFLMFLDLGNNKLTGKVPTWIGVSLRYLTYLQLRENNFSGNIPSDLALLPNLQVLDIANNNLEGSIPDSFGNFSAMVSKLKSGYSLEFSTGFSLINDPHIIYYNYTSTLELITKGEDLEYSNTLYLVNSIDLSGNNLHGFIPNGIVTLKALENLNLSRNNLNGEVPKKIGNIKSLESLDLSFNKLSGELPQSISDLTFLSHLNLSYNNLSGPIPVGNQLNSINDFSVYIGNAFLCGGIMNHSCSTGEKTNNVSDGKRSNLHPIELYLSVGAGFVMGWWAVWCILLLHGTWSATFYKKVDYLFCKLFK